MVLSFHIPYKRPRLDGIPLSVKNLATFRALSVDSLSQYSCGGMVFVCLLFPLLHVGSLPRNPALPEAHHNWPV